jgi:hypothetical protein
MEYNRQLMKAPVLTTRLVGLAATPTIIALGLLMGCQIKKSATVTGEHDFTAPATNRPTIIYVADFELPPGLIQHQSGLLPERPGPVGQVLDRLHGASSDRASRAQQLVALMSKSLLTDFAKAGFKAVRLPPEDPLPAQGWLVRGSFSEVQEGNRLQRSMVGLGTGQTDIRVLSCVHDLSQGPPRPLYEIATDATSGQQVGAAPTIALGPYGAAVAFVRAGQDVEKNVKQTAAKIVEQVANHIQNST